MPLLDGASLPWRSEWFYEFLWQREGIPIPRTEGVRSERWKYNVYLDGHPGFEELYDLDADPEEETNLATSAEHQDSLEHMRIRHQVWKDSLADWQPGGEWADPA